MVKGEWLKVDWRSLLKVCLLLFVFHLSLFTFHLEAAPLVLKNDYRSPRNKERPIRKSTRLIVLHTTEAPAKSSLNKLCERGEAHYCVPENGVVYRIVDRDREAFHAGRSMWSGKEDCDEYSIGIEVVGHHDQPVTLQQLDALKELVDRLKKMYNLKDVQVVCHSHVAYGAPNTWHKKKHRGRKRCGMLFAMASVRTKLGLTAKPAFDPDVKAGRLVQADPELARVLYGTRDTMAAHYGSGKLMIAAKPPASSSKPVAAKPKTPPKPVAAKPPASSSKPVAAKPPPPPKPVVKASPPPIVKPPLKSAPPTAAKASPPPIVKPDKPINAPPSEEAKPEEDGIISSIGSNIGGFFKSTAKLIVPKKKAPEKTEPPPAAEPPRPIVAPPRPKQILARDPRNLAALESMEGYVKGGPVTHELTPFKIAGAAWKSPSTYYYMDGRIVTGDKVNEKSIETGTLIFYRK